MRRAVVTEAHVELKSQSFVWSFPTVPEVAVEGTGALVPS
jgi:hypothetical protein